MGHGPLMPKEGERKGGGRGWAYNGMRITSHQQCETTLEHFTYHMVDRLRCGPMDLASDHRNELK